ncbi:MAG: IS91 family transposase, partial [Planctomycetes bacterium]|nr:IS91 family transposase [Planctomycetota bacterium]
MPELADVFRLHGPAYLDKYRKKLLPSHRRVMRDVRACRTQDLDGEVYRCPQCLQDRYVYHSCKNRHCPKCQNDKADQWLAKKQALLLPVIYYMVTFTLPSELWALVRSHQKALYNLLFRASSASLQKLAQDPRHIGGTLGMLGVLQTWKRDLGYHPHIHYIIPGGGLASDGKTWLAARHDYLMPEKAVAIIFRAKFRDGLKKLGLFDQVPTKVWKKDWVIDIEEVGSGKEALKYLTPYIFRVAISNKNILAVNDRDVTFRYRDRESDTTQIVTLPGEKFMGRFLQHVLPKGFQKVRTFGLYHPKQRRKLKLVKEQLQPKDCETNEEKQAMSDSGKAQP